MREMFMMVLVLTLLSVASGGGLNYLKEWAEPQIEENVMEKVKRPAIDELFKGAENDPIKERFKFEDGEKERIAFPGVFNGQRDTIIIESEGKGYAGKVGLIVAFNTKDDTIYGVGVTTHTETPDFGGRAKTDPTFVNQFKGKPAVGPVLVSKDGGKINSISGATITSRAICKGTSQAIEDYKRLKPKLMEQLKNKGK